MDATTQALLEAHQRRQQTNQSLLTQVVAVPEEVVAEPEKFDEMPPTAKPTQKAKRPKKTKQTKAETTFQVNRTPVPLIRQLYSFLRDEMGLRPNYILDPSAGDGRFQKVALEEKFWPDVRTVGVEPRVEEEPGFEVGPATKHLWHQQTFEQALEHLGWFDLAVTNPPFMNLAPKDGKSWIPQLLQISKVVVILAQNDLGQRSTAGAELFTEYPPAYQLRIRGAVGFRDDGGTDARDYSWFIWIKNAPRLAIMSNRPQWVTIDLPRLPSGDRKL